MFNTPLPLVIQINLRPEVQATLKMFLSLFSPSLPEFHELQRTQARGGGGGGGGGGGWTSRTLQAQNGPIIHVFRSPLLRVKRYTIVVQ